MTAQTRCFPFLGVATADLCVLHADTTPPHLSRIGTGSIKFIVLGQGHVDCDRAGGLILGPGGGAVTTNDSTAI